MLCTGWGPGQTGTALNLELGALRWYPPFIVEVPLIRQVRIENFKSIEKLTLGLGRVTVLIGENGSGKSNLLEAIAFASAAANEKLDYEFLASRGIRLTEPRFMRAAFADSEAQDLAIRLSWHDGGSEQTEVYYRLYAVAAAGFSRWAVRLSDELWENMARLERQLRALPGGDGLKSTRKQGHPPDHKQGSYFHYVMLAVEASAIAHSLGDQGTGPADPLTKAAAAFATGAAAFAAAAAAQSNHPPALERFIVFSPEYAALRTFEAESQILPLGIRGEGLFSHLKALSGSSEHAGLIENIAEHLTLIGWFERFEVPGELVSGERALRIRDRFLAEGALFDQRSANEGFLFLLLYFTLMLSPDTPSFFAIDNVDASLNPKLCSALMKQLVALAKEQDKQVIVTTHNPAVLDGLDLHDEEQQLWVVERSGEGRTRAHRVSPPRPLEGQPPMKLSEAFLRGYIGGLPKGF